MGGRLRSPSSSFTERRRDTLSKPAPPLLQLTTKGPLVQSLLAASLGPETAAISPLLFSSLQAFPPPPDGRFAAPRDLPTSATLMLTPLAFDRKRASSLPGILPEWNQLSDDEEEEQRTVAPTKAGRESISTTGSRDVFYEATEDLDPKWLRALAASSSIERADPDPLRFSSEPSSSDSLFSTRTVSTPPTSVRLSCSFLPSPGQDEDFDDPCRWKRESRVVPLAASSPTHRRRSQRESVQVETHFAKNRSPTESKLKPLMLSNRGSILSKPQAYPNRKRDSVQPVHRSISSESIRTSPQSRESSPPAHGAHVAQWSPPQGGALYDSNQRIQESLADAELLRDQEEEEGGTETLNKPSVAYACSRQSSARSSVDASNSPSRPFASASKVPPLPPIPASPHTPITFSKPTTPISPYYLPSPAYAPSQASAPSYFYPTPASDPIVNWPSLPSSTSMDGHAFPTFMTTSNSSSKGSTKGSFATVPRRQDQDKARGIALVATANRPKKRSRLKSIFSIGTQRSEADRPRISAPVRIPGFEPPLFSESLEPFA